MVDCTYCHKQVEKVSQELWGRCKSCTKDWHTMAKKVGWDSDTKVVTKEILEFIK